MAVIKNVGGGNITTTFSLVSDRCLAMISGLGIPAWIAAISSETKPRPPRAPGNLVDDTRNEN